MAARGSIGSRLYVLVVCQTLVTLLLSFTISWTFSDPSWRHIAHIRVWMLAVGIAGTGVTIALGLSMLRTILPRIHRLQALVLSVRGFQESGTHKKIGDTGKDDIAALANAIDAGFDSIVSREKDHQQFLAVAAHEFKTPVTAIQGYASLLASGADDSLTRSQAIQIIYRQSSRLARLIEALFLAARIRSGNMRFEPRPFRHVSPRPACVARNPTLAVRQDRFALHQRKRSGFR